MDYHAEIEQLETQLAETDRAATAGAEVRERLAKLKAAQDAEAEARQRALEAAEAAGALREAQERERQAQAGPLLVALADVERQLAADDAEVQEHLARALEATRPIHARRGGLVERHDQLRAELAHRGEYGVLRVQMVDFAPFVRERLARALP